MCGPTPFWRPTYSKSSIIRVALAVASLTREPRGTRCAQRPEGRAAAVAGLPHPGCRGAGAASRHVHRGTRPGPACTRDAPRARRGTVPRGRSPLALSLGRRAARGGRRHGNRKIAKLEEIRKASTPGPGRVLRAHAPRTTAFSAYSGELLRDIRAGRSLEGRAAPAPSEIESPKREFGHGEQLQHERQYPETSSAAQNFTQDHAPKPRSLNRALYQLLCPSFHRRAAVHLGFCPEPAIRRISTRRRTE